MHSRHRCLLVEVEVKEDRTTEEKGEAHREVDETTLQALVEGATTRIKAKAQDRVKHKDKGMKNLKSNVIIVKKYGNYANECRKKKNDMGNKPSVNLTKENHNHGNVLLTCNVAQEKKEDVRFLDSG